MATASFVTRVTEKKVGILGARIDRRGLAGCVKTKGVIAPRLPDQTGLYAAFTGTSEPIRAYHAWVIPPIYQAYKHRWKHLQLNIIIL